MTHTIGAIAREARRESGGQQIGAIHAETINVRALLDQSARVTKVRARAPLRLGFAGGGTDIAPYSDTFGGCVLNATIGMFAHCSIEVRTDSKMKFVALDYEQELETSCDAEPVSRGLLALHTAVHQRIVSQFLGGARLPVTVMTNSDAPAGSGLGSSSTLVVAMIEAYRELLALPLGEYDVARLAYEIERIDVGQAGGKQDQYAATFGGINFMEFNGDQTIVNPLRIRNATLMELEAMLVLYFTGVSRESTKIIAEQSAVLRSGHQASLEAMHQIKRDAHVMKAALLHNDLRAFSTTLGRTWEAKKRTAAGISNAEIDRIFDVAAAAGAWSGKVSGAGGGGFLFFTVAPERRPQLLRALAREPGTATTCCFTEGGAQAWRV
jgi:D-glycero-alpha-D-manno-heptose-7-phosphate kinase